MTTETEAFPVAWGDPSDAERTWNFDTTHTPDVMTPLGYDLYYGPFIQGFGWLRVCQQNYYVYMLEPTGDDAKLPEVDNERVAQALARWRDEVIPEVVGYANYYRDTDFESMSNDQLASEIEKLPPLRLRSGHLHTVALTPFRFGMVNLIDTYKDLTGEDDDLAAVRLVQGHGNKSVEAGRGLWQLARLAEKTPPVARKLFDRDALPPERLAALRSMPEARPFLDAFGAFLDEFGWRNDLFEMATPTWAEQPDIPLDQLRAYLEMPDYDPAREQERLASEREAAIASTMAKLSPEAQGRLRAVIDLASEATSIQEDHNYYIDQRTAFLPRRLVLAAGRWLVQARALEDEADVFYLRAAELLEALAGGNGAAGRVDACKAEMARWAAVDQPEWIGAAPPDESERNAFRQRFLGTAGADGKRGELSGNGASAGVARGPARVLMHLSEGHRLQPGDVLVARTTMPAWTPLFAVASAVITETGGVLSHCAVVAREYGIPAVLNVSDATHLIHDGQLLEVDGNAGVVRVVG